MTGFARAEGHAESFSWVWEIKSVNSKSLDLRFRLGPGFEALEVPLRAMLSDALQRGSIALSLTAARAATAGALRVNREALAQVTALAAELVDRHGAAPPRADGLLALRGVLESGEMDEPDTVRDARQAALLGSARDCVTRLVAARREEGARLKSVLEARFGEIDALVVQADATAAAQPEALKARLRAQLTALLDATPTLSEERLAQEAALLAAKADLREELDRLKAHVTAARELMDAGGAVGRRFDFLCQELNREANTLCSKSSDLALTRIGLGLKSRFRTSNSGMAKPEITRRGILLVLSSPSGAGKSTITRAMLARAPALEFSVSVTTRKPRAGERDGRDYHFIGRARFDAMVREGALLEHAAVFGNNYGTPRAPIEAALAEGRDIILDLDWQGTQQLKQAMPADVVAVFILPPDRATLEQRLRNRAQDSDDVVRSRMVKSADELSHWPEYDYHVVNEALEDSIATVTAILVAERAKRERLPGLADFVNRLREEG
jgi:guanylate kinase